MREIQHGLDAIDWPDNKGLQISERVICYNLDDIVAGITPQNLHAEISFCQPVGLETL